MNKNLYDLLYLIKRNIKMYFKDKGTFLISLITPAILLILFITFLRSLYTSSLEHYIPEGVIISSRVLNGFTAGWLVSSILASSCITIAFCSNTIIIADRANGIVDDILVTPVKKTVLSLSYLISNYITTTIVCLACLGLGFGYMAIVGWYLSFNDVIMIILNTLLLTLFGSLLATIIESFIKSMGVGTALSTLVSSMYGFLCGAYMPISQFSDSIQNFIKFLPGTYGTILFRYYFVRGATEALGKDLPAEAIDSIRVNFDTEIEFFGNKLSNGTCFLIVGVTALVLLAAFIAIVLIRDRAKVKKTEVAVAKN
ncbi:MAG TPA: ABC transporter permease [Bacilli bacterium]|nr:ABC transporter permease [Bacilli bacterium]